MMYADGAGKPGVVVDVDVSAQQRAVGQHDVVAELAVVGDVRAAHEEVAIAQPRDAVFLLRGAVDGHALADDVVVTDDDAGVRAAVAEVLRFAADHHARENVIPLANGHVAHQGDVAFQTCFTTDAGLGANDAERADFDIIVDFGAGSIETLSAM